jgi:tetratricopeptide (TPR) repeat protein
MGTLEHTTSMLGKIAGYIEILSKDPHSTVFVSLAETFRQMGLVDDALEVARKGVAALPTFCPGYTELGRIQAQRGALKEAEEAFAAAVEIDNENQPALKGLARVYGLQGQRAKARKILERARVLQPDDPTVLKMLAALGPPPPAAPSDDAARGVHASPESVAAGNEKDRAPAGEDFGEPIATATIAEIYVRQGLLDKALRIYRDLLRANPGDQLLAERYRHLGGPVVEPGPSAVAPPPVTPAADHFEAGIEAKALDGNQGAIVVLNRWLEAIRDRRAHVR